MRMEEESYTSPKQTGEYSLLFPKIDINASNGVVAANMDDKTQSSWHRQSDRENRQTLQHVHVGGMFSY